MENGLRKRQGEEEEKSYAGTREKVHTPPLAFLLSLFLIVISRTVSLKTISGEEKIGPSLFLFHLYNVLGD